MTEGLDVALRRRGVRTPIAGVRTTTPASVISTPGAGGRIGLPIGRGQTMTKRIALPIDRGRTMTRRLR